MKKIKLMLVEDQELLRESFAFVLNTDDEIEVIALASDGEEAVSFCETTEINIILMDIQMPNMNGIEATRIIKQRWPEIRIIILTTFQDMEHIVNALSFGAEGYLLKAIPPVELISGIKHIYSNGTLLSQDIAMALVENAKFSLVNNARNNQSYGLTEREEEVLQLLATGLSNKNISERLFLTEGTVKNYISSIYHKLDVKDRIQAITKAKDEKLINK